VEPVNQPDRAAAISANLDRIRQRIANAGGDVGRVKVVAMSKGFDAADVQAAMSCGLHSFGENYGEELCSKAAEVEGRGLNPEWHFTGRLQSRRVGEVADVVSLWQTVDRTKLVDVIAKHAPGARVLIQVNAAEEPQKGGVPPSEVSALVRYAIDAGLRVEGLMTMGVDDDLARTDSAFGVASDLADSLSLPELSMGMTDDLELAVKRGATMIRIGRALFQ